MIKRLGRTILVLGMVLTTFSWLVPSASADGATVPVCPADEMAVRAALIAARYGGTVLFTCDAHITLADKLLLGDVTIDGNGFDVTIDGNNAVGVFSVFGTVSLIGLHIVNGFGSTAGAIYADKNSTLRIANSTLSGNHVLSHGGAIFASGGSITIVDSTISDNVAKEITPTGGQYGYGGAIFGSGTLVIDRSTINNNVSMNGGAILGSFSRLSISNSTLSGNSADIGGAIKIGLSSSVLEITNSTLAGNSARYGSTIMFDAAATLNATNSIFAGGGPSTTCVFPYAPTVNDLGGNLANDASCGIGTFASLVNLKLGPLADNGGPTQTIALGNGSVAIGAGDSDVCNADPINGVDQRGSARLTMTCDSGAFDTGTPPDTTAPTITPTISGTLGESGWYTSDVDVSWSVVDAESTVSSSTGCEATTITEDTTGTTYTCEATSAGGSSSESVTIKRDATAPVVSVTGVADGASYNVGSVPAVGCTTTDGTSGVATDATLSTSGGPLGPITATCAGATDNAGNAAAAVAVTYNVTDTTAPTISYVLDTNDRPLVNGWYNATITLIWTVTDPESSETLVLDGCENQYIDQSLPIMTFSCSATSAGGSAGPVTVTFGNDRETPDVTFTGLRNDAIYPANAVPTPVCEATDATSGVAEGWPQLTYDGGPLGQVLATCMALDVYGNITSIGVTYTVVDDTTAPVITPTVNGTLGANGWYTSDVDVTWSVVDDESAISSSTGCEATTVTTDTTGTTFTCEATSAGGTASQSVTIGRDATAPVVSVTGIADGAVYTLGDVIPAVGCNTTDATSGVATQATVSTTGGPVGDITVTCAGATDNAGNTAAAASATYSVQYDWNGFSGVVKNQPKATTWIALLPVPVLFSIDGNQGRDAVTSITSRSCSNAPGVGEVSAGSLFNIGVVSLGRTDQYLFIWTTPRSWARTCRVLTVTLADGTSHEATFNFR